MEGIIDKAKFGAMFEVECWRLDKDTGKRFLAWREYNHNIVTNEGLNHILDVTLHGKTLISPWYVVMSKTDEAAAAGMTYKTPVYDELTEYDEATRPEYVEAAASSQSITNSANKATFTISGTVTCYAAGLVGGSSTKDDVTDDAAHVLLCYSKFGSSRATVDDDVVNVTVTMTVADA